MIYIDTENLTEEIQLTTDQDNIKNCFRLEAGDDLMTAMAVGMSPTNSSYIYYFAPELMKDMSKELQEKLAAYDVIYNKYLTTEKIFTSSTPIISKYNEIVGKYKARYEAASQYEEELNKIPKDYIEGYSNLMAYVYESIDFQSYLESSMMPTSNRKVQSPINAQTEKEKLDAAYDSGDLKVATVSSVSINTDAINAETAIKNWAKFFIKTGYVKLTVNTIRFYGESQDSEGRWKPFKETDSTRGQVYYYKNWEGTITVQNNNDDLDTATTKVYKIQISDNEFDFMNQKIKKQLTSGDTDDYTDNTSVFYMTDYDVLNDNKTGVDEDKLKKYRNDLTYYSKARLQSFNDGLQAVLDVLIAGGQGEEGSPLHEILYKACKEKMAACEEELALRQQEIEYIKGKYYVSDNETIIDADGVQQFFDKQRKIIEEKLNIETYLGDQFPEFCSYRREDTYNNSNYISEGLSTAEINKNAKLFLEAAQKELKKAGTPQHSISTTLANLMELPQFASFKDQFVLGNWIHVKANDIVYRLRLISWGENTPEDTQLEVEFSDVTIAPGIVNDINSILSSAQSMSTSYSYVQKQAEKGTVANGTVNQWITEGLNTALMNIKSNVKEEVTVDNRGIIARSYDDVDGYDQEQVRLTHNILCYTDDNWKTVKQAIGKHSYKYYDESENLTDGTGYGMTADFVTAAYITGSQIIGGDVYSENYGEGQGTHFNLNDGTFSIGGGQIVYDGSNLNITWGSNGANAPTTMDIAGLNAYLNQIDGKIKTYNQETDPSKNWDEQEKPNHLGDIWYDSKNKKTKMYNISNDGKYLWIETEDKALRNIAESKAQIFTDIPNPPYYIGDLWVQGETGDILNCIKQNITEYNEKDWEKSSKYTDDTYAEDIIKSIADDMIISPAEKQTLLDTMDNIKKEYEELVSQARSTFPTQLSDFMELYKNNLREYVLIYSENEISANTKFDEGDIIYKSTYLSAIYHESNWIEVKNLYILLIQNSESFKSGSKIYIKPPSNPKIGDFWIDDNIGRSLLYNSNEEWDDALGTTDKHLKNEVLSSEEQILDDYQNECTILVDYIENTSEIFPKENNIIIDLDKNYVFKESEDKNRFNEYFNEYYEKKRVLKDVMSTFIQNDLNSQSYAVQDLKDTISTTEQINAMIREKLEENSNDLKRFIRMDAQTATITLGYQDEKTKNSLQLIQTPQALQFQVNNEVAAEFTNTKLNVSNGQFTNTLAIGTHFEFVPRADGGMSLRYKTKDEGGDS